MNERIKKLREQSENAVNKISVERAILITDFYQSEAAKGLSVPVLRAKAFEHVLKYKKIYIHDEELIVGERGHEPKATPTYPEICLHSLKDLDILDSREKVSFKVDDITREIYQEKIIPYWKGKTQRDRIFKSLPKKWKDSYSAGVFTEFLEQRAPGHTVAGKKIFQKGLIDLKDEISASLNSLDYATDREAFMKHEELKAMNIVADAMMNYAIRHAEMLKKLSEYAADQDKKKELDELGDICRKIPAFAPSTFHQALQHYWFFHIGVITELNPWDSFNPGRLDQHLYPFYKKDMERGILTKERAKELLQSFWIKFNNHPAPPKVGVTALESNTYTDFALINIGGLTEEGLDGTNELSYLILDVIEEMRILQPSSMIQVSKKSPEKLLHRAAQITKTGFGQPSYFNTDAIIQELLEQGKSIEDARNGGASGCVETGAFGTESYILTGYFNINKILEITLNNGIDPVKGKKIGIETGDPVDFKNMDELLAAYKGQLNHFINIKIKGNTTIEKLFDEFMPAPFLSLIIEDCIANGKDYNSGGARYNTSYIQGVGLGSIADNLSAIEHHVYKKKTVNMKTLLEALSQNFKDYEELRHQLVYNTPKYGNDDDEADKFSRKIFNIFYESVNNKPTYRGGVFRINLLPTTSHVYFGSVIGAMPDGRLKGKPLSEGISPVQGMDTKGPTAVIKSASKIDHIKTGGTLLNQKFLPSFFDSEEGIQKFIALIRSYFRLGGHHIQFNVVTANSLKKAQKHPEKYRDLIVRVAGYSDYFNDLGEDLQNEIISRTAHEEME